jgi:hypothetical protein
MLQKYYRLKEAGKLRSAIDHSNNSRNSTHGYLEVGNTAGIHALQRALDNNNNTTETVIE